MAKNFLKYISTYFLIVTGFAQALAAEHYEPQDAAVRPASIADEQSPTVQPSGEAINKRDDFANIIYSDIGIDHSIFTLSVGYGRYLEVEALQRRLLFFADYGMPLAKPDLRNFRLRLGLSASAFDYKTFRIPVRLSFNVAGANNKIFRAIGLGTEMGIAPGYYGRLFEVAPEFYWDQKWATHIKNSDWYREYFYENAKDGWYGMSSSSWRAGIHFAWRAHERFLIGLKGGYQRFGQYNVLVPPVYCTIHSEFRF